MTERWSAEQARKWYEGVPQIAGANFLPSTAVNSTEMWMNDTFDAETMARELAWAADFGLNSLRVFLPFCVWEAEGPVFLANFERFLAMADENGMTVLPILFDDCVWDTEHDPFYGKQLPPVPGVHNSRWTACPGGTVEDDPAAQPKLRQYVLEVVGAHRDDPRIVAWDIMNEPGNADRVEKSLKFLSDAFAWARECGPVQPLTAGIWSYGENFAATNRAVLDLSDVVSFHGYMPFKGLYDLVNSLKTEGRPLFLTEWMARELGSTVETHLPWLAEEKIASWAWGCVAGRTQTYLWWAGGEGHEIIWQHDLLYRDGTPYRENESKLYRKATGKD